MRLDPDTRPSRGISVFPLIIPHGDTYYNFMIWDISDIRYIDESLVDCNICIIFKISEDEECSVIRERINRIAPRSTIYEFYRPNRDEIHDILTCTFMGG